MYEIYILECEDSTLYTGIAKNTEKRFMVHFKKTSYAAKYTRSHAVKEIKAIWTSPDRSSAQKLEFGIKKLTRVKKISIIEDNSLFADFFPNLITGDYERIK